MNEFCNHYRAMSNSDSCEVGILYESVVTKVPPSRVDFPCWNEELKSMCVRAEYPTPEESATRLTEIGKLLVQFQADLDSDICPHCKAPIQRWKQVGRCVYAEPCGDRLYQGKVPKGKS